MTPDSRRELFVVRLYRAAVIIALVIAPGAYVAYQVVFDPRVAFLSPSFRAQWARHPAQEVIRYRDGKMVEDVDFSRTFEAAPHVADLELQLHAFGQRVEVALNGRVVFSTEGENWKQLRSVHLGNAVRPGANRLDIRVHNAKGVPVLLVEQPPALRTPDHWRAALGPDFTDERDVVLPLSRQARPGPLQVSGAWPWLEGFSVLWLAGWSAVAMLCCLDRRAATRAVASATRPARVEYLLPAAFIFAALCLNLANAHAYPYRRSPFDWQGHVAYVERVAATFRAPMASDGWQMFQPPLYYFLAALIYRCFGGSADPGTALKAVQFIDAVAGTFLSVVTWLQLRLLRPHDVRGTWLATAMVAFLPMSLYMNPLISNEAFAGTVIALSTYLLLRLLERQAPAPGEAGLAGIAAGAGLLAKFTGLFSFLTGVACLLGAALTRRRPDWRRALGAYAICAGLVGGWFYLRNTLAFGSPLVGAWNTESGFAFVQEPTFRTLGFLLAVGRVFFQHPASSIWTGFLDGHYATLWADSHSNFFSQGDDRGFFWMSILLLLGVAPTAATLLGLGKIARRALSSPSNLTALAITMVIVTTWWSLLLFALRVPTYSSIKAFYWLSLVPSLGVCLATGRATIARRTPWACKLLDTTVCVSVVLAACLFRF